MKSIGAQIHYGEAFIHTSKINNPGNCLATAGINYTFMLKSYYSL
jgi:hypothetical protein